ncbi:hypothetical protein [Halopiger xanaduensis]|uniref:Uncharacterized protein n=1 Tax=Halopiger xanaduensis (strain DSM 18323 / JCM 14033 / SH-6) TaxID=797210 RepID=F8D675_HALXS|nr:hypothetical protein [Halopiger xanaduensis]AEH35592.1 hypothetical protein Halxa_0956 [Halopiger xanaduensis SH-6]
MNENHPINTNRLRTFDGFEGDAYVEDYRIRPQEVRGDQLAVSLLMRIGGPHGRFTLRAEATFIDGEDERHRVEIRRPAGDLVDEFEVDWTAAAPTNTRDATQAFHEVYVGVVDDWYNHALAAEEAGEEA